MKKIELVLQSNQFTSFTSYYLEDFWRKHFDITIYDPSKSYNKTDVIFVFWWATVLDELPLMLKDAGYRVVIDRLWEYPEQHKEDFYYIEHLDWFRLNESLWWKSLGFDRYRENKTVRYRAFMSINRSDKFRDFIYSTMEPLLDEFIWSYRDKELIGDTDREKNPDWQRFMNPYWYDNTYCSIVVESKRDIPWCTEKSYKPIAYYHPFLIASGPNHLRHLKSLGFETFDNIFDESYDNVDDPKKRVEIIRNNVRSVAIGNYDKETQRRIEYNHNHFFDYALVESTIEQEIVIPLIEYAET